jgi:hypothetical protein
MKVNFKRGRAGFVEHLNQTKQQRFGQIYNNDSYKFGSHLKQEVFCSAKQRAEAALLNKSSCLAPALGVTKFTIDRVMILVTL